MEKFKVNQTTFSLYLSPLFITYNNSIWVQYVDKILDFVRLKTLKKHPQRPLVYWKNAAATKSKMKMRGIFFY